MQNSKRHRGQRSLKLEHLESRQMLTAVCSAGRDDFTVGLVACESTAFEGYTLLAPDNSSEAHLLDIHGRYINSWDNAPFPGRRGSRLGPDGSLYSTGTIPNPALAGGGVTGALYIQDWDGNTTWSYNHSNSTRTLHHDIEVLPNGNVLATAWVQHTAADLIALGRNPANIPDGELWGEQIVELQPTGLNTADVVWEWNLIDHLIQDFDATKPNYGVIADHPERLNVNLGPLSGNTDWIHINSIDYNPDLDQILFNSPFTREFYIIDHSTTTAEAATSSGGNSGKGGDFLYRWGNPVNYNSPGANQLFLQHDAHWVDAGNPGAGNILVFNNQAQPNSTIVEIEPPAIDAMGNYAYTPGTAYGPAAPVSVIDTGVNAGFISGAQRLPNGNTMFVDGPDGFFYEVDPAGNRVWEYISPMTTNGPTQQGDQPGLDNVFKSRRYAPDFVGFAGKDLSPKGYVEDWVLGDYDLDNTVSALDFDLFCSDFSSGDHIHDLNFDDVLNLNDVSEMVTTLAGMRMGDANQDGAVDVSDFNIWNENKFQSGTWGTGDFNCDGVVDVADFNVWNDNKFTGPDELAASAGPVTVDLTAFDKLRDTRKDRQSKRVEKAKKVLWLIEAK